MKKITSLFIVFIFFLNLSSLSAHYGKLDSSECHNDNINGVYHCHPGGNFEKTSYPKENINTTKSKKEEVLDKYQKKLDNINKKLKILYYKKPFTVRKLLNQIKTTKSKLKQDTKNYIILDYIGNYLEKIVINNGEIVL